MSVPPIQVLQAATRPAARTPVQCTLLLAGATGVLGNEVLRRLAGGQRHGQTLILAREPITQGLAGVKAHVVAGERPQDWPLVAAETAIVLFEPPRLYYDRERALWTPEPAQLPALAHWLARCGVGTLAVVLPHAQGRLPEALKRGLASLDEHSVAAVGFERLLLIRSAAKPVPAVARGLAPRVAQWMLSTLAYMVPASEQPVRAAKVAELVDAALRWAPPGIHVAAPELVWRAAQQPLEPLVRAWLDPLGSQSPSG